ncbi:MAG TPA: VacJ family lipoprotein [Coxiellaceae bacterium]|nr:VacJ family lipoprotein [Coxiellaceae bacterium]
MKSVLRKGCLLLTAILVSACANKNSINPRDHYESFNRKSYRFNEGVDTLVYKPIAYTYSKVMPNRFQEAITHAYDNVYELPTVANDLLQFRFIFALGDTARFILNSTIGVLGIFDVAEKLGLPKHKNDFGLTLAYWSEQPKRYEYLDVPFLGPNTFRDTLGMFIDTAFLNPVSYIKPHWIPYAFYGGRLITKRAELLPSDKMVQGAFDPYVFVRDAYMQNRDIQLDDTHLTYRQYQYKYLPPNVYDQHVKPMPSAVQSADMNRANMPNRSLAN